MSKDTRLSLPPGTAVYPRLKTPDTKFDELGMYKSDVAVPLADAEPIIAQLSEIHKAHTGKAPKKSENTMWQLETDEAGEETGNVVFKCRIKNRMNRKGELWDRRPKLFDAALKPIDVSPWGGSVLINSVDVYCWDAGGKKGVSLQPVGVQVLKLVEGDGGSASDYGFGAKDGYTAPEDDAASGLTDQTDGDDDDSDVPDGDY